MEGTRWHVVGLPKDELVSAFKRKIFAEGIMLAILLFVLGIIVINLKDKNGRIRKNSENRFRAIIDNLPAGITLKDVSGRYLVTNNAHSRRTGFPKEELEGKTIQEVNWLPTTLAAEVNQQEKDERERGQTTKRERVVNAGLPDESYWECIKFPILDDTGVITAIGGISTETTEQKQTESALRKAIRNVSTV